MLCFMQQPNNKKSQKLLIIVISTLYLNPTLGSGDGGGGGRVGELPIRCLFLNNSKITV